MSRRVHTVVFMAILAGIVYILNEGAMTTITNGEWIADLATMTCRNILNKVLVKFEQKGKFPLGKLDYMPMELFARFAAERHGERKIAKLVMDAEEVFLRAYIESYFDRQDKMYKDLDNDRKRD